MAHRIQCRTGFDITATGVRSHYRENRMPFRDDVGTVITDAAAWTRSRNKQRNWETLNQVISLRCLPEHISLPRKQGDEWWFDFEVPDLASISHDHGDLMLLLRDAQGIPMITGLDEATGIDTQLQPGHNIWFTVFHGK